MSEDTQQLPMSEKLQQLPVMPEKFVPRTQIKPGLPEVTMTHEQKVIADWSDVVDQHLEHQDRCILIIHSNIQQVYLVAKQALLTAERPGQRFKSALERVFWLAVGAGIIILAKKLFNVDL